MWSCDIDIDVFVYGLFTQPKANTGKALVPA